MKNAKPEKSRLLSVSVERDKAAGDRPEAGLGLKPYGPEYKPRKPRPKAPPTKYQWPANKITTEDMALLYHLRSRTGTPINKLLQEAIRKFGEIMGAHASNDSATPATDTLTVAE